MGGQFLVFDGEVVDVPSLKAPGFIAVQSEVGRWPDASAAYGGDLILKVRSSTPDYRGWHVTFNSGSYSAKYSCAGGGSLYFSRGCYKAKFMVPAGEDFSEVRVPFASFSDLWDPKTGEQTKTCAEDSSVCPSEKGLAKIQMLEFMAEGAAGKVHLEVKSISAAPAQQEKTSVATLASSSEDPTCKWCERLCGVLAFPAQHGGNRTMQAALEALNKECGGHTAAASNELKNAPMFPVAPSVVCQMITMSMGKITGWLAGGATCEQVCTDAKYEIEMCSAQANQAILV